MDVTLEILSQAGLEKSEASVYTTLLENGGLTVLEISQRSNLKRTNLYNVLETLEAKNLVKKVVESDTTRYYPNSPKEIQRLFEQKEDEFTVAKNTFEIVLDSMQGKYVLNSHKPVITYLEGIQGLQKLYDDILETKQDILLIRSTFDDKRKDVDKLIQKQLKEQAKAGIRAKVVGPPEPDAKDLYTKYDKIRLVEEHFINKSPFNLPAQIIIYGTKTAIATIRKEIIITIIDNKDITDSYKVLFDFVWNYSKPEHDEFVKDWK